jgi:hypothetical protein
MGKVARPTLVSVNFRLTAPDLDFWVDVRLCSFGDRWMAVADIGGDPEVGLGATARLALAGSLTYLGDRAAAALLADPQLLAVSRTIGSGPVHE